MRFPWMTHWWMRPICDALKARAVSPVMNTASERLRVEYVPPTNPGHRSLYELLQQRRALEKVQEIFSPFQLPIDLTLKTVGCDGVSNAYYQRPELRVCYEYLDEILQGMPK